MDLCSTIYSLGGYGLSEEVVQVRKRVKDIEEVPTTVTLYGVPVTFRADVYHVEVASARQDYHDHRRWEGEPGEAEYAGANGGVDLDELVEEDLI